MTDFVCGLLVGLTLGSFATFGFWVLATIADEPPVPPNQDERRG